MTMKRSLSDSESDSEFNDDLKGDVSSPSQSHQGGGSDRKKRRGVIEKRRRDRINNSLAELRRLVPTAFEKQGSAKLEKAEILQMTVDHLKLLHQKGLNNYNIDPTALAMDYRSVGFRECAAEVARYLVTCEGMDIQDPLRLRLMSHLQCYSAQREVQKANLPGQSWGMSAHHPGSGLSSGLSSMTHGQYGTGSAMASLPHMISASQHSTSQDQLSLTAPHHTSSLTSAGCPPDAVSRLPHPAPITSQHSASLVDSHTHAQTAAHMRFPAAGSVAPQMPSVTSTTSSSSGVLHSQYMHSQFPSIHSSLGMNSMPMLSPSGAHSYSPPTTSALGQSSVKPYRPWGAELAY